MYSFRSEPFLWIHLAGLAVVPLTLELMWLGLSVSEPLPFFWLELIFMIVVGIVPVLWMQWNRPFDIFSLLIVSLKPEQMTLEQQCILSLFKKRQQRFLTVTLAIVMLIVLWQVYRLAPLATIVIPFFSQVRIAGLMVAALAFLLTNLFVQVSVSVLVVLLITEEEFALTKPYAIELISQNFTIPGFKVKNILPSLTREAQ